MQNNNKLAELIEVVRQKTDLSSFVIEKDIFVTQAISILTKVENEFYDLVFQGGTSLAKAHRIIERMSEDCDFRVRLKSADKQLSKEFKRKALRQFRHELIAALEEQVFVVEKDSIRVRNEGQFMSLRANYPSSFPGVRGIKPFIALEFFLAEVKIEPETKSVTSLIKQVLGDNVGHPEFPVSSIAIIETAAEKWVALTRRVATSAQRKHYRDPSLVRHLYDLFKINEAGFFTDQFQSLAAKIVQDDQVQYKNHNAAYYRDATSEIKRAVDELHKSIEWRDNWQQFIETMVYSQDRPSYESVLGNLSEKTGLVLPHIYPTH